MIEIIKTDDPPAEITAELALAGLRIARDFCKGSRNCTKECKLHDFCSKDKVKVPCLWKIPGE